MLKSIKNISFTDWKPILISLVLPLLLILILALHRRFNRGKRKEIKEGSASENDNEIRKNNTKNKKKNRFQSCYDFSSILGWETDTTTTNSSPQAGPISLTVSDKLGFSAHETNPAQDQSEPGPNSQITIGHLPGRTGDRKHRKWVVSMKRAAARFACGNPTVGEDDRSGEGKPLISLMKEMDRAEQSRKPKRVLGVKRDKAQNGNEKKVCHVCSQRSNNATLVPCGHQFCRVCSREIWINTRSCPICKTRILEVLDTL